MTKKSYVPDLIPLLCAVCLTSIASAQTSWWKTYGGTGDDEGFSAQQTFDGGYVVAGYTTSFGAGGADVYLVKTDSLGDMLWTRTYGGARDDYGYSVQQTSDGGYIIAGSTSSFGAGGIDVYLVKTNALGDTLWTRTYGGARDDYGSSVQQTADGGYIITGWTYSFGGKPEDCSAVFLVKTDEQGDTIWTRAYVYDSHEGACGNSVRQTADGGYIIAGGWGSFGVWDLLLKTDAQGDTVWSRCCGTGDLDWWNSVRQTSDGGYVATGLTGGEYVHLVKTGPQGDTLWTRTFGGTNESQGNSVQQTTDGDYVIAGATGLGEGGSSAYLIKTDVSGDMLWSRTYGRGNPDEAYSVEQTLDGGYVIAGATGDPDGDVLLIKIDASGSPVTREPVTRFAANPSTRLLVQPNPFTSVARVPGHETEFFALSDVTGRHVAICKGDRIGAGLRPGVYFLSPVGLKRGKAVTIIKAAN